MNAERRALSTGGACLVALATFVSLQLEVATDITHFLPQGEDRGDVHLARELAAVLALR